MKKSNTNRSVEDLFREEFQNFEIEPSKGLWSKFNRRLRTREFLRFNPGKFNAFYLGAIVVGVALVSILNKGNTNDSSSQVIQDSTYVQNELKPQNVPSDKTEKIVEAPSKGSVSASLKVTTVESQVSDKSNQSDPKESSNSRIKETEKIDTNVSGFDKLIVNKEEISSNILVKPSPSAGLKADNNFGCIPLKVNFDNLSANYDSCMWEFGDGGYSNEREPVWIFDEEGDYEVKLIVFGADGITAKKSTSIKVYPSPIAKFEVSTGDPTIPEEHVMFYNYSENASEWSWDFGDGEKSQEFEPSHQYNKHDSYSVKLKVVSPFGCTDSIMITDAFGINSCFLRFPNVFIPNNGGPTGGYYSSRTDRDSEVFHPAWSGVTEYNLRIFSRTGLLVFETTDINVGWDGYYKGQKADSGVYIWKVRGVFKNGDPFVQGGDVTLLPNR